MTNAETPAVRGMAQDLVNWLWAFFFTVAGLQLRISAAIAKPPQRWPQVLTGFVLLSVGGAALLLCSLTIWREFRRRRKP